MAIDRLPVDWRYISRRLVTEIVQENEAMEPRRRIEANLRLPGLSLSATRREPNWDDYYDLANRATEAVRDNTGTLESPGKYIRTEVELSLGHITVRYGWEKRPVKIAMMIAERAGGPGTLLALVGSMSNYVHEPFAPRLLSAVASDVMGFYTILAETEEAEDPQLEQTFIDLDQECRLNDRVQLLLNLRDQKRWIVMKTERVELLAQEFFTMFNLSWAGVQYNRLIIGAPVWVRTPAHAMVSPF